jgi:hypothetical protein
VTRRRGGALTCAMGRKGRWWSTSSHDAWCRAPIGVSKAMKHCWGSYALATETSSRWCRGRMLCPTRPLRRRCGHGPAWPQPHIVWKHVSNGASVKPGEPTMRSVIGQAGSSITRSRDWRRGFWSGTRIGGKKWTPALTVPQIRQGIAAILCETLQCGTRAQMLAQRQKRLQRHALARFSPWKQQNRLNWLRVFEISVSH